MKKNRDLKPENLLLDENKQIKIVDFGLGNLYKAGQLLKTACGSPCYAAPEMIAGKKYNGLETDIWSSGIILFAMLCGYLPFEDQNTPKLYEKILKGEFAIPNHVSKEAKDLLHKLLTVDPKKRINISNIKDHCWVKNHIDDEENRINSLKNLEINKINGEIIEKMSQIDIKREYILKCLSENKHNHITATYYLLEKKLKKEKEKNNEIEKIQKNNEKYKLNKILKAMNNQVLFAYIFFYS